jgi:hypothetical protein
MSKNLLVEGGMLKNDENLGCHGGHTNMKNESSQIDVRGTATEGMCMSRNNTTMN